MQNRAKAFPWGVFAGELFENGNTIPLFLPAQQGGFTLFFDEESETESNRFIENLALHLSVTLPPKAVKNVLFDFSYKKRFPDLALLKEADLYEIALDTQETLRRFSALEKISLYRHHELLTPQVKTISDYNRLHEESTESYYLLLINLHDFPDSGISPEKIKAFFASAFEVGFYTIAFGTQSLLESRNETVGQFTNLFPSLRFEHKKLLFGKAFPVLQKVTQQHTFRHLDADTAKMRNTVLYKLSVSERERLQEVC